jgi:sugar-specific transcriptional regulator TrmB
MSTTTAISTLEELGLAKNEAVLYDALLKTTDSTIPILLKTTPFSRTLLYYLLGNLEGYGLITSEKAGSKTKYNAEPPEKLADMIQDKEKEFHKQKDLLKNVMGDLYSTYRLAHNKPGVKFFEGVEGLKETLYQSLDAQQTIYTYTNSQVVDKYLQKIDDQYVSERLKRKIKKRIIMIDNPEARAYIHTMNKELTEVKLISEQQYPFNISAEIYNDTITYLTATSEEITTTVIKHPQIALFHKSIFQGLWDKLPNNQTNPATLTTNI